jgi:hypothetical protein
LEPPQISPFSRNDNTKGFRTGTSYVKEPIVVVNCDSALVGYNISDHGAYGSEDYTVAMWSWNCRNTVFQYNEVKNSHPSGDGQSFDLDGYNQNCIIQYNYSHDNAEGFLLICQPGRKDNIVRYNISVNDGCKSQGGKLFTIWGDDSNTDVYNNVFYIPAGSASQGFDDAGAGSKFRNNIVCALGSSDVKIGGNWQCSNNVLFGKCAGWNDANKITVDPQFINGGNADSGWAKAAFSYTLKSTSPAIDKGVTIIANGGKDYSGNLVPHNGLYDIGAMEYPGHGPVGIRPAALLGQNQRYAIGNTGYYTLTGKRLQKADQGFMVLGNGFIIKRETLNNGKMRAERVRVN